MTIKHPHNTDVSPALNSSPLLSDCGAADGDCGTDGFIDGVVTNGEPDGEPDGFTDVGTDGKGVSDGLSTSSSFNSHEFFWFTWLLLPLTLYHRGVGRVEFSDVRQNVDQRVGLTFDLPLAPTAIVLISAHPPRKLTKSAVGN